jgi:hypothetical protein
MNWGRLLTLPLALSGLGCTDLDRFSTGPTDAYCGSVTLATSFRTGLSPRVQMRLTLDARELSGPGSPGAVTTFEAASGADPDRRLLDEAQLRRIPPMENDPLSHLEIGDGRVRNAVFAVSPADADAESILSVVSLRDDGDVEVRLIRPGRAAPGKEQVPEGRRPIFGIFPLSRQVGMCGF